MQCESQCACVCVCTSAPSSVSGPVSSEAADARLRLLASAYRSHGHLKASLDPLALTPPPSTPSPLTPEALGLQQQQQQQQTGSESWFDNSSGVLTGLPHTRVSEAEAVEYLEEMYCGTLALEASDSSVSVCTPRRFNSEIVI